VWRGVQSDLGLPAPAIAVSGTTGLQLWFSLREPVSPAQAQVFLSALCRHYLPEVPTQRLRGLPMETGDGVAHAARVPALQAATGHWSAFVAPDLAPIFEETPWIDVPPGDEGQAHLLSHLASIQPAQWAAALATLRAATEPPAQDSPAGSQAQPVSHHQTDYGPGLDPRGFLLAVMNDPAAPLALRIEAAKALLP